VVTGKLIEHPYPRYQQRAGAGTLIGHRLAAEWIALANKDRPSGLKAYAAELQSLLRQLEDARALTWSTEFSDALGRSQSEIKALLRTVSIEIHGAEAETLPLETRLPVRTIRTRSAVGPKGLAGELVKGFEGDWPYLAF
jgi:hypothetical protein